MKHLILTLSLILGLATSVSAQWEHVYSHPRTDPHTVYYVDVDNIRQRGSFVYAERLVDLVGQKWETLTYKSAQQKLEIDCISGGFRILNFFAFTGYGGSGRRSQNTFYNECRNNMCYPASNTVDYHVAEKICQRAGF